MKIQINSCITEDSFGIVFIPTIVFYKDKTLKGLLFTWLCFELALIF